MMQSRVKWLHDVISPEHVGEFGTFKDIKVTRIPTNSICLLCKGSRMLCGKSVCPIITKAQALARSSLRITSPRIEGSTPPAIFVGRIGYPKVYIGPMVPPFRGDTTILDTPELWLGKEIQDIVDYRFALIRGKAQANINEAKTGGRLLDSLQELAMGKQPVDAEALLTRIPHKTITLSGESQPFGPSAPLKSFKTSNVAVDRKIERAFYDRDLKAVDAVAGLYENEVLTTRIQRAFSLGMFGTSKRRRIVPTRWSITAVDSIISQKLVDRIKQHGAIDEYRVYSFEHLDNRFVVILMPERWSFEWIEAWFPGTTWNPNKQSIGPAMMGDFEPYRGRTTYPDVGGCYYACKLAIAEGLDQEQRQATALVLREVHPGYSLPIGVWLTRESIRQTMKGKPQKFDNLQAALNHAVTKLTIPLKRWIATSALLKRALYQRKITEFGA